MKILIVGAGIGGLSAAIAIARKGHQVVLYEAQPRLSEVGAGVQLGPNALKLWLRWGLGPDILEKANVPQGLHAHNWKSGRTVGYTKIEGVWDRQFGAPYIVIHRGELHQILHRHALKQGVEIMVDCRVVEYDFHAPGIKLATGERVIADMVVAADAINSSGRKMFLGSEDTGTYPVGWAGFRMLVDVKDIQRDPEIAWIVSKPRLHIWIGPGRSVMTYTVLGQSSVLNVVLSHPDDIDTSGWTGDEVAREIKTQFGDWNYAVRKLIALMRPNPANWPIYGVGPLPRWSSQSGRFVLMGDAAHSMAFYMSSAVSMAVEDAACLAECIHLSDRIALNRSLKIFQKHRIERTAAVANASLHAGNQLHLADGERQKARDESIRVDESGESSGENICGLFSKDMREWIFAYDAEEEMRALLGKTNPELGEDMICF